MPLHAKNRHRAFMEAVARDIAKMKDRHPQLRDYSPDRNLDVENQRIVYAFRTHRARHSGGWTSGVPNPDPDGVWFHIDLHDPESSAQIHTQPIAPDFGRIDGKVVWFLLLEGTHTKSLAGEMASILNGLGAHSDPQ